MELRSANLVFCQSISEMLDNRLRQLVAKRDRLQSALLTAHSENLNEDALSCGIIGEIRTLNQEITIAKRAKNEECASTSMDAAIMDETVHKQLRYGG